MNAPKFLSKTDLSGYRPLATDAGPVILQHARLRGMLSASLGPAGTDLFAEPVVTRDASGNLASVAWYAPFGDDPVSLTALRGDQRVRAEATVAARLRLLAPLLSTPREAALAGAALSLAALDGVFVDGDRVVLTGWGLVPSSVGADPVAVRTHAAGVLGTMSPFGSVGEAPRQEPMAPPGPPPPQGPARAAAGVATTARSAPFVGGPGRLAGTVVVSPWSWWLLPAFVLLALVFLAAGIYLGWTIVQARMGALDMTANLLDETLVQEEIARQRETNRLLEAQIADAEAASTRNVCTPANPLGTPLAPAGAPVNAQNLPPPSQNREPFRGTLLDLFDQGTVFVVGRTASGEAAFGSGFFVTPDRVVTNAHVVTDMHPDRMFVTNRKMGRVLRARVVAVTPTVAPDADYAILRVEDVPPVQPLALATSAERIQPVIAAGYPALVVTTDARFDSLLQGDVTGIPELVTTPGSVSTLQAAVPNRPLIAHTAQISQGNSGGPLFDNCGRVVGVNTFGRINAEQAQSANYAQKIDSLLEFLSANGVQTTILTDNCQLIGNPNTAPVPAQGQPAPAQGQPPPSRPATPPAQSPPTR